MSILSLNMELSNANVLDIGTGSGHIAYDLSNICAHVSSVDMVDERVIKEGYDFFKVTDEKLPFDDKSFDIIISNQILEHVKDQGMHLSEIKRVLKMEGIVYLATPNRYWIIEPHYHLPFLSWFPRRISTAYLKLVKNKVWDVNPLSYSKLKRISNRRFAMRNITPDVIKSPDKYNLDDFKGLQPIIKHIPLSLIKLMTPLLPSYILLLRRTHND